MTTIYVLREDARDETFFTAFASYEKARQAFKEVLTDYKKHIPDCEDLNVEAENDEQLYETVGCTLVIIDAPFFE